MKNIMKLTALVFFLMACTASPPPPTIDFSPTTTLTPVPVTPMPKDERLDAYLEKVPVRTPQPLEALPPKE